MEINPYGAVIGIIVIVLLILIIASFVCMVLLMILQAMGLIRFRKTSHFIAWSIAGGIVIAIIFWQVKKSSRSSRDDVIQVRKSESPPAGLCEEVR